MQAHHVAMSYSEQYDYLVSLPKGSVNFNSACKKPSLEAQAADPKSYQIPFSTVFAQAKHSSRYNNHWGTTAFMVWIHGMCFLAPGTFTPGLAMVTAAGVLIFGLAIEMVYHRLICHKSFTSPKWFEYSMAYLGALNIQGDPIEWVSDHRYHHQHTDTPMDPHSPYEGFWWAHIGWLWDNEVLWPKKFAFENVGDLKKQPFYAFLNNTYWWHISAQFLSLWMLGGLPALVWLGCVRIVLIFHVTFLVNSGAHIWGGQVYKTNDLSKNCVWVALLSLGEWHNNHHAFEWSACTGLEWWQFDLSFAVIKAMSCVGLASNIKLPTEANKARLLLTPSETKLPRETTKASLVPKAA